MSRYFYRRRVLSRNEKRILFCMISALVMMVLVIVGGFHLRNMLTNLAVTRVSNTVTRLVAEAVNDAVSRGA